MQRLIVSLLFCAISVYGSGILAAERQMAKSSVRVVSPGGQISVEVFVRAAGNAVGVPHYRVTAGRKDVILDSPLQVELDGGRLIGARSAIEAHQAAEIREEYRQFPGKRSRVVNHCHEEVISFREVDRKPGDPALRWQLVVRAYDDGVAFHYRFPKQEGLAGLVVTAERTGFNFPAGAVGWALPLNSFTTSYERRYERRPIADLPGDWLLGLPLVVELPGSGWAAVTEANLTDYAGMYLAPAVERGAEHEGGHGRPSAVPPSGQADDVRLPAKGASGGWHSASLTSRLSPLPAEPKIAVRTSLPHDSPWRVIQFAEQAGKLIESDLLLNLNGPPAYDDVSWIKPGKTTFPWWNGYYEEHVPFSPGLNTATMKHYIDFCAEAGIPYHSLDGQGDTAWYGGPIVPYRGADITRAIDGLDLSEVLGYAKAKGVGLRLWMHWQAAKAHMARAFPLYRQWGIHGVMIDFMDRDDQEMVNFQRELLKTAADNHLTVTFHGVAKPTGLERTFPNLLTSEGVLNLEYDKWDKLSVSPEHEVTVPFTRMLAGPLDFHQGSLRTVPAAEFKPRNEAPLVIGTPSRTLASYVVLQNHLSMVADYPSAYRGHPALPAIARIPTTWDDTRFVAGEIGRYIVIARRSGDDWWIGAMSDQQPREITIDPSALGVRSGRLEIWHDDDASPHHLAHEERRTTTGSEPLSVKLAPAGGALVRFSP